MDRSPLATRQLVERHAGYLRRLARALVRDDAAAQDVVQETWRVALERRGQSIEQPRPWLAGIARRVVWRRLRDDERRAGREREAARPESSDAPDALDLADTVQAAMRRLEEPFREAIVQRYLHDLPPREIARRAGVPIGTVKSRLKRGLAALRDDLDGQHGGDRRTWSLALIAGFEIPAPLPVPTPGPSGSPVSADPLSAAPRRAPHAAAHGALWTATIGMNIKILTATVLVISFSLWALSSDESVDTGSPQLALTGPSAALASPEVLLSGTAPNHERDVLAAPAPPAVPGAAASFSFAMEFDVRDALGDPFAEVDVQIAPADHSFVTVGTTDAAGRLRVEWDARIKMMTVDVALVSSGVDLIGVQRLDVRAGNLRTVTARVPRAVSNVRSAQILMLTGAIEQLEERIVFETYDSTEQVQAKLPPRRRPRRGAPGTAEKTDGGHVTFGTDREGVRTYGTSNLIGGTLVVASADVAGDFRFAGIVIPDDSAEKTAAVEGFVGDEFGRPAAGYAVRFVRPSAEGRVAHVFTDDEGRFRIESPPGNLRCFVGMGRSRVQWERELAPGEVAGWNPKVQRKNDLLLHVSGPTDLDLEGLIVQVRIDDGRRLWIGRGAIDEEQRATIHDCPSATVDIDILTPTRGLALPFLSVPGVPTGDVWEQVITKEHFQVLPVLCTPDDLERPLSSASELLIFDESRTWGTRTRIGGEVGSAFPTALPAGTWWLEIGTRETGRTEIGTVHAAGDQPIELGAVPLEPLGEITFPPDLSPDVTVEVHRVRRDIDSCVATRTPELEPAMRMKPLPVRPGLYRVTMTDAAGDRSETTIEVAPGEHVPITP